MTSNLRPLLRAFYPFIIAIVVLLAVPRNAHAQHLYVTHRPRNGSGVVSEYNATTGDAINGSFIVGLSNFGNYGLAVDENTLFVSDHSGFVGKYNATTGAAISPSFITGLDFPSGLAVLDDHLFVGTERSGLGVYNATTGAAIKAHFITGPTNLGAIAVKR
ncbi:MAG TPA: hypothetical protein VHY59_13455 [Chthoniobacterales bacterium]|nr:hypothetical protein [Chthoniobacterales bacterium]